MNICDLSLWQMGQLCLILSNAPLNACSLNSNAENWQILLMTPSLSPGLLNHLFMTILFRLSGAISLTARKLTILKRFSSHGEYTSGFIPLGWTIIDAISIRLQKIN